MAKESVKARQRKRERMVAQYAEKRAALKAAGDYEGIGPVSKECFSCSFEKPLPVYRPSKRLYEVFRFFKNMFS